MFISRFNSFKTTVNFQSVDAQDVKMSVAVLFLTFGALNIIEM